MTKRRLRPSKSPSVHEDRCRNADAGRRLNVAPLPPGCRYELDGRHSSACAPPMADALPDRDVRFGDGQGHAS